MSSVKPMLAKPYHGTDPTGWWMSEKLDGVRAIWTGESFVSRTNKILPAPDNLKVSMSGLPVLDGELFGGRGKFQSTVGKVRRGDWRGLKFVVFDVVDKDTEFEERFSSLSNLPLPPGVCSVLDHQRCAGAEHLRKFEDEVLGRGGEGVMLRAPKSKYEHGRSSNLLKVKKVLSAEAKVVGYEPGKGKHSGRVGALVVEAFGKRFKIGTGLSDHDRGAPPKIGASVTFSYFELTRDGIPRFPVFVAVRDYE